MIPLNCTGKNSGGAYIYDLIFQILKLQEEQRNKGQVYFSQKSLDGEGEFLASVFVAMLLCAAGFQKSPWHDFVRGQLLLYHSTPAQGSEGMWRCPSRHLHCSGAEETPKLFLFTSTVQAVEVSD